MSILSDLQKYASECVKDMIPSGQKHKWACERFLKDVERAEKKQADFYWDESEAKKIVLWFSYLRHSKGVLAGQPIILTECQKFDVCQIYGWRNAKTGLRRFNKSFVAEGRKNGKSQIEAGVALYEISTTGVKNHEMMETYCAGTKREQSKIVFLECKNMLQKSPLRAKFKITRDSVEHIKTGSFLKPLSKEDGRKGDGTNPALLILDEYHQHDTTEYYDLGLGANSKEPLLMIITTAGMNLNCPCYQQEYKYCAALLDPYNPTESDKYFADIYEIDDGDDISDKKVWQKANPIRATYPEGIEKIQDEYKIAKEIPEKMTAFLTKCMNRWVQAKEDGYMDMRKWSMCEVDKYEKSTSGYPVYVGFDMSAKIDLTSVAFVLPIKESDAVKYLCYSHSFIPNREKLQERITKDKQPYDAWERAGYITVTGTEIVDQSAVMRYVIDTCKKNRWEIQCLCFDPANASKLMIDLSNEGFDVEEVYQSHRSLNEATAGFREQVYSGNVIVPKNPVLDFAMANAVVRTNNGLIKIDKDATKKRIDPVDAILCAFKLALYHRFERVYDITEWLDQKEW